MRILAVVALISVALSEPVVGQVRKADTDLEGLKGKVRSVRVETAPLKGKAGQWVEGNRQLDHTTSYDRTGNIVEQVFRYRGPGFPFRHLYSYDKAGNRLEKQSDQPISDGPPKATDFSRNPTADDGSRLFKWALRYDSQGNRIEEAGYFGGRFLSSKTVHQYDAAGHRIETTNYRSNGSLISKSTYAYDDQGNPIELLVEKHERSSLVVQHFVYAGYQFDSFGNWIKRVASELTTKDGKSHSESKTVTHRTIDYY